MQETEYTAILEEIVNVINLLPKEQQIKIRCRLGDVSANIKTKIRTNLLKGKKEAEIDMIRMELTPDYFKEIRAFLTTGVENISIDSNMDKENIRSIYSVIAEVSLFIKTLSNSNIIFN